MGNSIIIPNQIVNEKKDGTLSDFINQWALENYTYHQQNNPMYKELLKKRACCLNQPIIPISLPYTTIDNTKTVDKTIIEYKNIPIIVFANTDDITTDNCKGKFLEKDIYRTYMHQMTNEGFVKSQDRCTDLYPDFCAKIKDDRSKVYDDIVLKLYGSLEDTNNAFIDCNCENSFYNKIKIETNQVSSEISGIALAQTIDTRCSSNLSKTYQEAINKITSLCFNKIELNNDIIESINKGEINIIQNCSQNDTSKTIEDYNTSQKAPTTTPAPAQQKPTQAPTTQAPVPTTQAPTQLVDTNKKTINTIIISSIMIIVIINLIFLLRK